MSDVAVVVEKPKLEGTEDISGLYALIRENPNFLRDIDGAHFADTPLHAAVRKENTALAVELLNLMPSFGKKLNTFGLSPLHSAVDCGAYDTASKLAEVDRELVRVKGVNGLTPLHYLVMMMNDADVDDVRCLELLTKFLHKNPDCIDDVNNKFQTVVHLALEYNVGNNNKAFRLLLGWIVRRGRTDVLGWSDDNWNTPLHVAVQKNNIEAVNRLILKVKRNKTNKRGQTALDVADELNSNADVMKKLLTSKGTYRSKQLAKREALHSFLASKPTALEWAVRSFIMTINDITVEIQNVLLVVAALITTATYTALLQPPGGVYQVSAPDHTPAAAASTVIDIASASVVDLRGKTVIGVLIPHPFFMKVNTVAFTLSLMMFTFVLHGKTYYILLHACLLCLAVSYLMAMKFTSAHQSFTDSMFLVVWVLIGSAYALKWVLYLLAVLLAPDVVWAPSFVSVNLQDIFYNGPYSDNIVTNTMAKLRRQYRMMMVHKKK